MKLHLPPAATKSCIGHRTMLHLQQINSKNSCSGCISPNSGAPDRSVSQTPAGLISGSASLFSLFYRKLSAAGCSFAAEILDRGRFGKRNNSGTNSSRL
jgi:hypothetical protein